MRSIRFTVHVAAAVAILPFIQPALVQSQEKADSSDRAALGVIFAEQHTLESAWDVHRQAAAMTLDERLAFLSHWVLPSADHASFRLNAAFTPTHPAPPAAAGGSPEESGGEVVSPALDLIEAALALDKLDDVRRQTASAAARSVEDQIARLAMLALIDMAREDFDSAGEQLAALFAMVPIDAGAVAAARDALLLCVHEAGGHSVASKMVVDSAYRVMSSYLNVYDREPWHRQFSAAYARVRQMASREEDAPTETNAKTSLTQWRPASRLLARNRGSGCPVPLWKLDRGEVFNLASHDDDYLYFQSPLRGNFEVECDVTGFGWRDSHLLTAGKWVAPVYDHESYDLGSVRGLERRERFSPPLTKTRAFIHYRTAVRNGVATTWFNGRKVHDRRLPDEYEPWLAIRSSARHEGGVRNLWITGEPHIPAQLHLSGSPSLAGWVPYFEESIGGANGDWRHHLDPDGQGEIHGRRRAELSSGCHNESLLVYHRPMFEDGSIEYEFWHEPGMFAAHPALDRLCFMLEEDGVKIHWLTDGEFERAGLAPDNVFEEPDNRRGAGPLPLKDGGWNRVRLTVTGDNVALALNDQLVYERPLEALNQRTFGLFHYADRSRLRVRNVTWKGDWPRQLPSLDDQELAVDETGFIDERLPQLKDVFSHDFATDGLPLDRFSVLRGDIQYHISVTSNGVRVSRPAVEGYRGVTIAPNLVVRGDFDITASFDHLVTDARGAGSSNLMLMALADNQSEDEALLLRRRILHNNRDQQLVQCVRVRRVDGNQRRQYFAHQPLEAVSGTLRLARRGDQIYYLFAESDSEQFRLIGQETYPTDDLQLGGVRFVAQIHGDEGATDVLWKRLEVRAERLSGLATQDHDRALEKLNRERAKLAKTFTHDFTRQPPDEALFNRWTDHRPWQAQDQGLLIVSPGTDHWSSAGASLLKQIEGDFDISIQFEPQQLETPADGKGTAVYLQLELADDDDTQLSMILNKPSEGGTEAIAQLRVPDGAGDYRYQRLGKFSVQSASGLRIARRGAVIYYVISSEDFDGERVVAHQEVNGKPVKIGATRILVHTGGRGRESRVLWKGIRVSADRIVPESPSAQMPKPTPPRRTVAPRPGRKPQPKSTLRSIFDFFFD